MNENNRDLLAEVIENRLVKVLNCTDADEEKVLFKEAMEAVDKQCVIDRNDNSVFEREDRIAIEESKLKMEMEKLELDKAKFELSKKEFDLNVEKFKEDCKQRIREEEDKKSMFNKETIINIGTFAAGLILAPTIDYIFKTAHIIRVTDYEKEGIYSTSPARAVVNAALKFKK